MMNTIMDLSFTFISYHTPGGIPSRSPGSPRGHLSKAITLALAPGCCKDKDDRVHVQKIPKHF